MGGQTPPPLSQPSGASSCGVLYGTPPPEAARVQEPVPTEVDLGSASLDVPPLSPRGSLRSPEQQLGTDPPAVQQRIFSVCDEQDNGVGMSLLTASGHESAYTIEHCVFEWVPRERNNKKPIETKFLDHLKALGSVRSRLVRQQFRWLVHHADCFTGAPPSWMVNLILSRASTGQTSNSWGDVCRATR